MNYIYEKLAHAGSDRVLMETRRRFWVLNGKRVANKIVGDCIICMKLRKPMMAHVVAPTIQPMSPVAAADIRAGTPWYRWQSKVDYS